MTLTLETVTKRFGRRVVVDDISLEIPKGQIVAILGPSGSGKTTLLRLISGLEVCDRGRILFDGKDMAAVRLQDRGVGLVFQHYALFRHMRVFDNIAFGLRTRRDQRPMSEGEVRRRVEELVRLVQLEGLEGRFPAQLSGGQRQRVALARALAVEPEFLLLDEPFGALDAMVRKDLRGRLRELHDRTGRTTIFVTHDQDEALELADRVVVMNRGRVEQVSDPDRLYDEPASPFVFEFIGGASRVPVSIRGGRAWIGDKPVLAPGLQAGEGTATLFIRPENVCLSQSEEAIDVFVVAARRSGPRRRLGLASGDGVIRLEMETEAAFPVRLGDQLRVEISGGRIFR